MLKNYASTSAIPNIFGSIDKNLIAHGAKQIVKDYDGQGKIIAIQFLIEVNGNLLKIRLPAKIDQVERIFQEQGVRYKPEQPYRTAWATIRDWLDAQMALLDWEAVKMEEIFLPYMVNKDGRTFFEVIQENQFMLGSGAKNT